MEVLKRDNASIENLYFDAGKIEYLKLSRVVENSLPEAYNTLRELKLNERFLSGDYDFQKSLKDAEIRYLNMKILAVKLRKQDLIYDALGHYLSVDERFREFFDRDLEKLNSNIDYQKKLKSLNEEEAVCLKRKKELEEA